MPKSGRPRAQSSASPFRTARHRQPPPESSRSPNLPPGAATGVSPSLIQLKAMVAAHYNVEPDQVHNFDTQKLEQLEARMDEIADHLPPKAAI